MPRLSNARQSQYRFCAGVAICSLLLTYWPHGLPDFRYERSALVAGQWWRLFSAHLVHLNTAHLLLNLLGLFLIGELLWGGLPLMHALALLACAAGGISGLLWWLHPELASYAGLSGVLHGLWAGCALAAYWNLPLDQSQDHERVASKLWLAGLVGLALLAIKLLVEWQLGASPRVAQLIGAPVVTIAHFYGALIGSAYVLIWYLISVQLRKK